jgi:hypothetical protein
MGNRADITTKDRELSVYVHWNGGRDSVEAFLTYCKIRGFRSPEKDPYGWARMCQVIGNFMGKDGNSLGIDKFYDKGTGKNFDNGLFIIENYQIVGRKYYLGKEQSEYDLKHFVKTLDSKQPIAEQLGEETIDNIFLSQNTKEQFYAISYNTSNPNGLYLSADNSLVYGYESLYFKKFISEEEAHNYITNKLEGTKLIHKDSYPENKAYSVSKENLSVVKYEDKIRAYFDEQTSLREKQNVLSEAGSKLRKAWIYEEENHIELFFEENHEIKWARSDRDKQAVLINEITKYANNEIGFEIYKQSALAEDETTPGAVKKNREVWEQMKSGGWYKKLVEFEKNKLNGTYTLFDFDGNEIKKENPNIDPELTKQLAKNIQTNKEKVSSNKTKEEVH